MLVQINVLNPRLNSNITLSWKFKDDATDEQIQVQIKEYISNMIVWDESSPASMRFFEDGVIVNFTKEESGND